MTQLHLYVLRRCAPLETVLCISASAGWIRRISQSYAAAYGEQKNKQGNSTHYHWLEGP